MKTETFYQSRHDVKHVDSRKAHNIQLAMKALLSPLGKKLIEYIHEANTNGTRRLKMPHSPTQIDAAMDLREYQSKISECIRRINLVSILFENQHFRRTIIVCDKIGIYVYYSIDYEALERFNSIVQRLINKD